MIGSCNLEISLVIHCFASRAKMAFCFETFLDHKIWAISEAVVLTNTKKVSYFGLSVSRGRLKIIFMLNLQQNCKNAPKKIPEMFVLVNKVSTSDVFNLQKVTFFPFYPTDLVKLILKQLSFSGRWTALDIYLDASRLDIYPPPLTSPSGDSCIIISLWLWVHMLWTLFQR